MDRTRLSKKKLAWINEAFSTLIEEGSTGVTAEHLSKRLNLTRGSFYHHYGNIQNFHHVLLRVWHYDGSHNLSSVLTGKSGLEKLNELRSLAWSMNHDLDVAIRAWSLHYPLAKEYQEKMDKDRLRFIYDVYREFASPEQSDKAVKLAAKLSYFSFIGAQNVLPKMDDAETQEYKEYYFNLLTSHILLPGGKK